MRRRPATEESTIARAKHFEFPASVEWEGGSLTVASIAGKQDLDVATPPGFGGENEEAWSPEDLLVASAATCFAVTLAAIVRRGSIPLLSLQIKGTGHVGPRDDGRLGFTSIELAVAATNDTSAGVSNLQAAIERAEHGCLVAMALSVPVNVQTTVSSSEDAAPLPALHSAA